MESDPFGRVHALGARRVYAYVRQKRCVADILAVTFGGIQEKPSSISRTFLRGICECPAPFSQHFGEYSEKARDHFPNIFRTNQKKPGSIVRLLFGGIWKSPAPF